MTGLSAIEGAASQPDHQTEFLTPTSDYRKVFPFMSALVELLASLAMIVIELTWWALVFLYSGLMSIFSRRHREKFLREWHQSTISKVSMVLLIAIATVWVGSMTWFWASLWVASPTPKSPFHLTETQKEQLENAKKIPELTTEASKRAIEKLKKTWRPAPATPEE